MRRLSTRYSCNSPCLRALLTAGFYRPTPLSLLDTQAWLMMRGAASRGSPYERASWQVLLRRGRVRGFGRAGGDGLLPLRILSALVRRTGQRLHAVESQFAEDTEGRGAHRYLPQNGQQPAQV